MMNKTQMYQKIYLELAPPSESDPTADKQRVLHALKDRFGNISMPYEALKNLYPLCRDNDWHITITAAYTSEGREIIRIEGKDTSAKCYALAVDYGSTSITAQLVELTEGTLISTDTVVNPQTIIGDEILSRIFYTKDNCEHLNELQSLTVSGLKTLIKSCAKKGNISENDIMGIVISGNTAMIHFLLGLFPWPIFYTPYAPVATSFGAVRAKELDIPLAGYVYITPCAANYLGGDIMSGLLCTNMDNDESVSVFLDIGTNGELVIGNKDFLVAGAGAAGPAFEAGISEFGMRAEDGAVNHVKIEGSDMLVQTVSDSRSKGICGSGIVELIAEMFLCGWIDSRGTLIETASSRIIKTKGENGTELAVCYAWEQDTQVKKDLLFTQKDIYRFIQTKAAAHTMVVSLLEYVGIETSQISKFYLAGAFGTYTDIEAAITIGLYPDLPRDVFVPLGNASLKGSRLLLEDITQIKRAQRFVENISYVQFGEVTNFVENMRAAEFLPHTRLGDYPSVSTKLEQHKKPHNV